MTMTKRRIGDLLESERLSGDLILFLGYEDRKRRIPNYVAFTSSWAYSLRRRCSILRSDGRLFGLANVVDDDDWREEFAESGAAHRLGYSRLQRAVGLP